MVNFGSASHTVNEGDSVTVTVKLSAAPERSVVVPMTTTELDGASNADYSGVPAELTFAGDEVEQTFTLTATEDTEDDAGERVTIGFGSLLPREGFIKGRMRELRPQVRRFQCVGEIHERVAIGYA